MEINIEELLKLNSIKTVFQPIVSTKSRKIIGFEALTRGIDPSTGNIISPILLFSEASKQNLLLDLDRVCRVSAINKFKPFYDNNKSLILFLNFDVSILDHAGVLGSDHLFNTATNIGVPPQNIVIEFIEERVHDTSALQKFVANYRNYGFVIAIDDIGSGHSNLDRFFLIRPDIMKIDRSIVKGIDTNYYKQEIFKSLSSLAKKTGALLISEGTETESEVLISLELGADLLQGYFFCEPKDNGFEKTTNKLEYISSSFKEHIIQKIKSKNAHEKIYEKIINTITRSLAASSPDKFESVLYQYVGCYPLIECIYILDQNGMQVTNTILNSNRFLKNKSSIFHPAVSGESHELKDYFYFLGNIGISKYATEPYISLASGNLCITISQTFRDILGDKYIICLDISASPVDDIPFAVNCVL